MCLSLCLSEGLHLIEVLFDDVSVPKSPFRVSVTEGCDPSRVRAYGPGLEEGLVNKPNRFTVETRWFLWINSCYTHLGELTQIWFLWPILSQIQLVCTSVLLPVTLVFSSGVLAPGVLAWPLRVHLKQRCHARTTKMAAVVWSTSPSLLESTTSTSPSEAYLSQVTGPPYY